MPTTSIPYGSAQAVQIQSAGLFAANMQRPTTLGRLTGKLPTQADAESNLRFQSGNELPIVRCMDLTKKAGDEITFDLINPIGGKPIMGEKIAEGLGDRMSFSQDSLRINQARKPISAGGSMTQQRTPHQLRSLAQEQARSIFERFTDQACQVHLAGARGFHNDINWCVPLAADPKFSSVMVNTVRAPSRNRHFISTGSGIEQVVAGSNEITIATTDVFNADVVVSIATWLDGMSIPLPSVIFDNDEQASDAPLRVLMVSAEQYNSFVQSTNFRTYQAQAMARGQQAKNNPVFMGDALLWRGILILKQPRPIRFYAGDPINWCASTTASTETTTDLVPAAFGTTYAVDRAILLGGQALAEGYGKHNRSLGSFFTEEEWSNFHNDYEYLIGEIAGRSKIRFLVDHGESLQYTDNGVAVFDTAVRLAGV